MHAASDLQHSPVLPHDLAGFGKGSVINVVLKSSSRAIFWGCDLDRSTSQKVFENNSWGSSSQSYNSIRTTNPLQGNLYPGGLDSYLHGVQVEHALLGRVGGAQQRHLGVPQRLLRLLKLVVDAATQDVAPYVSQAPANPRRGQG